jgi:hypothetical protein
MIEVALVPLPASLGEPARWTIEGGDNGPLRKRLWKPRSGRGVEAPGDDQGAPATTHAPDPENAS